MNRWELSFSNSGPKDPYHFIWRGYGNQCLEDGFSGTQSEERLLAKIYLSGSLSSGWTSHICFYDANYIKSDLQKNWPTNGPWVRLGIEIKKEEFELSKKEAFKNVYWWQGFSDLANDAWAHFVSEENKILREYYKKRDAKKDSQ